MPFPSCDLVPLASVNRRFHSVVSRILHRRMLEAASLPDNDLILECYHPSAKISTPYLACRHLGVIDPAGSITAEQAHTLPELGRLYSSFHPVIAEENRRRRRPRPQQPLPGLLVMPESTSSDQDDDTATEDVYLDEGERFSQLCAVTNLVKQGPKRGLFISHVNIGDSVVRLFRHWLGNMAGEMVRGENNEHFSDDDKIIWVDTSKDVGLRFQVISGPAERMPLISGPGDEPPVSYKLVYEGESGSDAEGRA